MLLDRPAGDLFWFEDMVVMFGEVSDSQVRADDGDESRFRKLRIRFSDNLLIESVHCNLLLL